MEGLRFNIKGDWGHFKIPYTNNNPQTYSIIPKTALLGIIGAVCGIDRKDMKELYPILSEEFVYSLELNNNIIKESKSIYTINLSNYFDLRRPIKSPKPIELIKNVDFNIILILKKESKISKKIFDNFKYNLENNYMVYQPYLGQTEYICYLDFLSYSNNITEHNGLFKTKGFVNNVVFNDINLENSIIYSEKIPISQDSNWYNNKYRELKFTNSILQSDGNYIKYDNDCYFTV